MSGKHARGSTRTIVVAIVAVVAAAALLAYLAVWIPGLPGPLRGAYIARGVLHNINGALRHYDDMNGHLPPATAADTESGELSSWRIEVYRWFAATPLDYDYRKPWNDPLNLRIEDRGVHNLRYYPNDVEPARVRGKHGWNTAYYKAITGRGTAFDSATPASLKQLPKDLVLVVRVERSDTHWMEPGDLSIEQLLPTDETRRLLLGNDGYVVLFADGEGWILSGDLPVSDLCKFFTIGGAEQFDREQMLAPYRILPRPSGAKSGARYLW